MHKKVGFAFSIFFGGCVLYTERQEVGMYAGSADANNPCENKYRTVGYCIYVGQLVADYCQRRPYDNGIDGE